MKLCHILSFYSIFIFGLLNTQAQDSLRFKSKRFHNLFALNDSVYRSEQPSKKAFKELENYGFKTIINFRRLKNDKRKAQNTNLKLVNTPMRSAELTETKIIEALKVINEAEKPVLVHCWHGSDRTGIMVAAYRIVVEKWTKEAAISEFRISDFGYHENWYPNLVDLLENLNTEEIRKELGIE